MTLHLRLAASAVLTIICLLTPAISGAQAITAPVIAQARAQGILDDKANRTASERKLDANLLFAMRAAQRGAVPGTTTPGIPAFVQSFIDREVGVDSATFVSIRASATAELAAWLQGMGARDINEYEQFGNVTATVPLTLLLAIGDRPEVQQVGPRELSETQRYFPTLNAGERAARDVMHAIRKVGLQTWEGVTAHQANLAQSAGITGAGVKVCVLSDGVDTLAGRQATGDLPAVSVLAGQAGSGDEGTAMLEIIHDMAPGASLGYATGDGGFSVMASNIVALRNTLGCDIIVDDLSYFTEAAFQDDTIAQAVNTVTTAGALYFSAAANSGNLTHGTSGTFEGDFVASGSPVPPIIATFEGGSGLLLHSFGALPYTKLTQATAFVTLKWSDANGQSANDYDVFITDDANPPTMILGASADSQTGTGYPVEFAVCNNDASCEFPIGSRIYIVKYSGVARALRLDTHRGQITPANATAGSTYGHNAAGAALSVAASSLFSVSVGAPFNSLNLVTYYSSDGPRKIFYNASGAAITPGNLTFATGGATLPKVDLTASDCGTTTTPDFTPFCGTSAAAPSAASIAALVKSAMPSATNAQVTAALLASAIDIEAAGTDRDSGVGIVMAPAAVRGVLTALTFTKSFSPSSIAPGGASVLTISVMNSNAIAINGVGFMDTYPALVVNAASPNAAVGGGGCTGTLLASGGGSTFVVANATIPASATCTFTVNVTSNAAGNYTDSSGNLATPIGLNTPGGSASFTVVAPSAQRAFVASFGSDANTSTNCTFVAPCRGFTAAMGVIVSGGEIIALDAASYGAITVTKSLSLLANTGFYAGITASTGDAVTIATPGVNVLMRGLNIIGIGGVNGINMTDGASLTLDNCVVSNFSGAGVKVDAASTSVKISNSVLSGNGGDGLLVAQGRADVVRSRANGNGRAGFGAITATVGGTSAAISIVDSFASGNVYGFAAMAMGAASTAHLAASRVTGANNSTSGLHVQLLGGTSTAVVGNSMFVKNATGMNNASGALNSLGNSLVDMNGTNTSGTITGLSGL